MLADTPEIEATELRSANRFKAAVDRIATDSTYATRTEALRIHASSLFDDYNRTASPKESDMREVISEFEVLVASSEARLRSQRVVFRRRRITREMRSAAFCRPRARSTSRWTIQKTQNACSGVWTSTSHRMIRPVFQGRLAMSFNAI